MRGLNFGNSYTNMNPPHRFVKGVSFIKETGKWIVRVPIKKTVHLTTIAQFSYECDAIKCYDNYLKKIIEEKQPIIKKRIAKLKTDFLVKVI